MKVRLIAPRAGEAAVNKLMRQYSLVPCRTFHPDCADCQMARRAQLNRGGRFALLGERIRYWQQVDYEDDLWIAFIGGDLSVYEGKPQEWATALANFQSYYPDFAGTAAKEVYDHYLATRDAWRDALDPEK